MELEAMLMMVSYLKAITLLLVSILGVQFLILWR